MNFSESKYSTYLFFDLEKISIVYYVDVIFYVDTSRV